MSAIPLPMLNETSRSSRGVASGPRSVTPTAVRSRFAEASSLQRMLPYLVAVELVTRQARWNVFGPGAAEMRNTLASLASEVASLVERVAGRLIEQGFTPDIRPTELMATAVQMRPGRLSDDETATTMVDALSAATSPAFDAVVALESSSSSGHEIARSALTLLRSESARLESWPTLSR